MSRDRCPTSLVSNDQQVSIHGRDPDVTINRPRHKSTSIGQRNAAPDLLVSHDCVCGRIPHAASLEFIFVGQYSHVPGIFLQRAARIEFVRPYMSSIGLYPFGTGKGPVDGPEISRDADVDEMIVDGQDERIRVLVRLVRGPSYRHPSRGIAWHERFRMGSRRRSSSSGHSCLSLATDGVMLLSLTRRKVQPGRVSVSTRF